MSLDTEIRINGELIAAVHIARVEGSTDTDADSVNDYLWSYSPDGAEDNWTIPAPITHLYGDGAVALVRTVLAEVDMRLAVAATYKSAEVIDLAERRPFDVGTPGCCWSCQSADGVRKIAGEGGFVWACPDCKHPAD